MDHEVNDVIENHEDESSERTSSVSRLDILRQIESGDIDVDDALKRLEDIEVPGKKMDVLEQLEQGTIDVQEVLHRLEQETEAAAVDRAVPTVEFPGPDRRWRDWWLIILASGLGVLAFGGWLGTIGGWWWVCGAPLLVLGMVLFVLAFTSKSAPWLHLRVDTGQQSWPRHIALSFPIPIKLASWGLRTWGSHIPRLDETAIDDLIIALEGNLSSDTPIYIEVQEDETTGERVQIFLG